ncbi:MAG: DUF6458 family protein [Nocardioidaceae bacterium]
MGAGLSLMVVGAILAFAVTDNLRNVNLGLVGLILMAAGAVIIVNARRGFQEERTVTRREESDDPDEASRVVQEIVRERKDDRHSR